jgi:hypothetical protein
MARSIANSALVIALTTAMALLRSFMLSLSRCRMEPT